MTRAFQKRIILLAELIQLQLEAVSADGRLLAGGGTGRSLMNFKTEVWLFGTNVHTWVFSIYASSIDKGQYGGKKESAVAAASAEPSISPRAIFSKDRGRAGEGCRVIRIGSWRTCVPAMATDVGGVMSVPSVYRAPIEAAACSLPANRIRYTSTSMVAKRSFLKDKGDIIGQFIRAMVKGDLQLSGDPSGGRRSWADIHALTIL